jgi:anaerobic ribonucleoside-triphosphate reductase
MMDLAKESLEIKRKAIENFIEKGLYPYSRYYLDGVKKARGAYYANHFSTIGLVGMNEALLNFIGENIASKRGRKFALEVMDFMRERLVKYQKETRNIYNLEATPAESSLAPKEKVLIAQSDPKLKEIGPLIDEYFEKNKNEVRVIGKSEVLPLKEGELYTYGFSRKDQKVRKYPVTALIRHPGDSMYLIETVSGRKVKVTKYHSVFTLNEEGLPQEVKVSILKKGDVIAIPKKIEMEMQYKEFNLIEEFKKFPQIKERLYLKTVSGFIEELLADKKVEGWARKYYKFAFKNVKYWWRKKKIIPLKLIYDLDIYLGQEILENSKIFYRKSKNTSLTKSLIPINRDLGFILGIILAEGWIGEDCIEITNTNKTLIESIASSIEKIFGPSSFRVSLTRDKRGYKPLYTITLLKLPTFFIKKIINLKGKSPEKSIPSFAYFSSNEFVGGLLKGFLAGDGNEYIKLENSDYNFRFYTNSKELKEGLNLLLLKLGILAKIRVDRKDKVNPKWKRNYILSISGIENLQKFYRLVLEKEFRGKLKNSGREKIPKIARILKDLIKREGLKKKDLQELGIWQSTFDRCVRKNSISWHQLKEILEKLEKKTKSPVLKTLKFLVEGDLYWDPIRSIRKIKTPKYVYDFEVNAGRDLVENFLGGEGLVCLHNTAYRLALKDKERYADIITAGTRKVPYYTNSTQLPVNYTDDIFEALKLQDELQCRYTGGCIEKGNKVLTNKGLLPIEYIVENFKKLKPIKALSYNKEKRISEWDEIVEAVKVDVKKHNKIRIIGERNLDITTSDWHPFFVLEKFKPNPACPICGEKVKNIKAFATHIRWRPGCGKEYKEFPKYRVVEKRADELKPGDYILQNSYNLYPEKKTELNDDLMWLIGFFIGDGCISRFIDNRGGNNLERYKVRFFSEHQAALEKVARILGKYFGCRVRIIQNDRRSKSLKEIATSKKEVAAFFFKYGFQAGKKDYKIYIPPEVKANLSKHNVFSLLSGLMDSDGHIAKRDGGFEYYTISSKLAEDILEICTLAGVMVNKSKKKAKRKNEADIWRLRIPQYEITKIKNQLSNTVHISRIKEDLSNRIKRHLPVVRVKEVSKVEVKDNQFYDLMTKKNHNYLAGKDTLVFIHNTVLHLFLGERIPNTEVVKNLVKKIFEEFKLPYITLTPTFSICPVHGYISGEHFYCPKCTIKQPCEVYSRVVGYLRPVSQYNIGKQQEFKERKEFKVKIRQLT